MHIVVCVKHVPEVVDADLKISRDGREVITDDLEFDMNEWDAFAVESALRLKEARGGRVTAVTMSDEEGEEVLRNALAMGADGAIRIDRKDFETADALGIARVLHARIKGLKPDLLLSGAQSGDTGWGQVGVLTAGLLGLPVASLVVDFELQEKTVVAHRELEANILERVTLPLPCALTIQTGIQKPRYVSIMGIKKVRRIEIETLGTGDLDLEGPIRADASCVAEHHLTLPEAGGQAEILSGSLDEICSRAAQIIRERGGMA